MLPRVVAVWLALVPIASASPQGDGEPLRVDARVTEGTRYVGEGIEVRIGVVAGGERPKVTPPRIAAAEIAPAGTDFRQLTISGVGDVVTETNLFVSRYRLTPTTAGALVVPPFRAGVGGRAGASESIRLTIRPVPSEGRPASYLRGVGRLGARAEAEPASVRVGQPFDYLLTLTGPGARNSTAWPTVGPVEGLTIGRDTTRLTADPPERTFRFRIRPSVPGGYTLPSVEVATFDPASGRYLTTRAPAVSVRVTDVPRFDPGALPGAVTSPPPRSRWSDGLVVFIVLSTVALVSRLIRIVVHPARVAALLAAREFARRARDAPGSSFGPTIVAAVTADRVASRLADYLHHATRRPRGELTPDEARVAIGLAVGDSTLVGRVADLVARCDRVRFGREPDPVANARLASDAASVFAALARRRVRTS